MKFFGKLMLILIITLGLLLIVMVSGCASSNKNSFSVILGTNNNEEVVNNLDIIKINATFNDEIDEKNPPKISIDTQCDDDIINEVLTKITNKVWEYIWHVPSGKNCNGISRVSINAHNIKGNPNNAAIGRTIFIIKND